jgi:hypothetical protein
LQQLIEQLYKPGATEFVIATGRPVTFARARQYTWALEFDGVELRPRREGRFSAGLGLAGASDARAVAVAPDGGLRVAGEVER